MAVERLARLRGLHITDDAKGNWIADIFDPKAATSGQLVEGKNLLEARASVDGSGRSTLSILSAQRPGNNQVNGTRAAIIPQPWSIRMPFARRADRC